jgi:hypothetical protein
VAVNGAEIPRDVICCGVEIVLDLNDAGGGVLIVWQVSNLEDGAGLTFGRHGEHLVDDDVVGRDDVDFLVEIWVVGTNNPEVQIVWAVVDHIERVGSQRERGQSRDDKDKSKEVPPRESRRYDAARRHSSGS